MAGTGSETAIPAALCDVVGKDVAEMSLGGGEILVILLVALIVFGPQRLPEIGRQVGKAMSEVRKMQDSVKREIDGVLHHDPTPTPSPHNSSDASGPLPGLPASDDSGNGGATNLSPNLALEAHPDGSATSGQPEPPSAGSFS